MVYVLIHKSSVSPVKCISSLAAGLTHVLGSTGVNVHCSQYPQPLAGPWVPNTSPGYCCSRVQNPNTPHQMLLHFSPLWPSWSTWPFSSFSVNQWEVWLCIHLLSNWGTCHPPLHLHDTQSYAGQIPCFYQVKDPSSPQQNPLNHLNSIEMSLSRSIEQEEWVHGCQAGTKWPFSLCAFLGTDPLTTDSKPLETCINSVWLKHKT